MGLGETRVDAARRLFFSRGQVCWLLSVEAGDRILPQKPCRDQDALSGITRLAPHGAGPLTPGCGDPNSRHNPELLLKSWYSAYRGHNLNSSRGALPEVKLGNICKACWSYYG